MDFYKSLQTKALKAVLHPELEDSLRHVFRKYSEWYHTPLHMVDSLPLEDVILAFFEHLYEEMDEQARLEQMELLIETEEEKAAREETERQDKEAEDQLAATLEKQLAESQEKKSAPKEPENPEEEPLIEMKFDDRNLLDEAFLSRDPMSLNGSK